jgi:hypothetical protein
MLSDGIEGHIPPCLFTIPTLQTLHLSGNGIHDRLSNNLTISPSLQDLSLAHNLLTGKIPESILSRTWESLDLSFNQFKGNLPADMPFYSNSSTLSLQVNRLSGAIPASLYHMKQINILSGNMFSCNNGFETDANHASYLPLYDPQYTSYQCGSDYTNYSLVFWFAIISILLVGCRCLYHSYAKEILRIIKHLANESNNWLLRQQEQQQQQSVLLVDTSSREKRDDLKYANIYLAVIVLKRIIYLVLSILLILIVFFMPVYASLSMYYGTYENQYIWTISFSFLAVNVIVEKYLCKRLNQI